MHLSQFLDDYVSKWYFPELDAKGFSTLKRTTPIVPSEYIKYAQADINSHLRHRHINALSNAKRAIDCQVDNIFDAFGLRKKRTFPAKIEVIGELGLLAPRILRKVVQARNLLEHQYHNPTSDQVEDAVDVATLFVEATSRPFRSFMSSYFIGCKSSIQSPTSEQLVESVVSGVGPISGYTYTESFYVDFEDDQKVFWIDCVQNNQLAAEIQVPTNSPFYIRLIKFTFDYDLDHHNHPPEEVGPAFISLMKELAGEL